LNSKKFDILDLIELHLVEQNIIRKANEINKIKKDPRLQKMESEFDLLNKEFEDLNKEFAHLEQERKKLEDTIAMNNEKIKTNEEKLFSGTITSSKELVNYQEEVKQFKQQNDELENKELEVMFQIDEARPRLNKASERKEKISEDIKAINDEFGTKVKEIEEAIALLKDRRNSILPKIPKDILEQYNNLRNRKDGIALAVMQGNFCNGCGLEIPASQAEGMKDKEQIYRCPMCARMLVIYRDGIEELQAEINEI
jgi:predicted  nucleic acid-binding Zn-ribbon protein